MLEIEKKESHWILSLNRPEVHNAFHPELIEALTIAYKEADQAHNLQAVFLKGNGKSFSAGADLNWMKEMANFSKEENYEDALKLFDMFYAIYQCRHVTMAYAHGNVFGGALGLLACQDIVIAEEKTKFSFSEVKWGLSPATISPFVKEKIGLSNSLKYMLSAEVFSAEKAKEIALVHEVGSEEIAKEKVLKLSEDILNHGAEALKSTKALLREQGFEPQNFRELTARSIAERRVSKEGQAGLNFFTTKEIPHWKKDRKGISL